MSYLIDFFNLSDAPVGIQYLFMFVGFLLFADFCLDLVRILLYIIGGRKR